jgi:CRP/FNR family cyclic AMP-dependent transcriptional regulator
MINTRQFEAGDVIFRENDIGETAYVIERGRVQVLKNLNGKNVHLAYIGAGEPFGEMSMIDEKPRSATVIAVEATIARELHRDDFVQNLQIHPDVTMSLLKVLFERLREANATILQLHQSHPGLALPQPARYGNGVHSEAVVSLEGLTPQATRALPASPFRITKFPFRIGRRSSDALANNDLSILDGQPWQISRNHMSFIKDEGQIAISDRGSTLGSLLNGQQVGGRSGLSGPVFLATESILILGEHSSAFKFKVTVS